MLKGTQKRMVVLRTAGSTLFETAYFVLRDDSQQNAPMGDRSVLEEANRIIEESLTPRPDRTARARRRRSFALSFALGAVLGAAICTVLLLLLL